MHGQDFCGVKGFASLDDMPEEFPRLRANTPPETEDYQNGMAAQLAQIPHHSWLALLTGLIAFDWLTDISGRVLVLWRIRTIPSPLADQETLLTGLAGGQLQSLVIENAGRDVMWDTPQAWAQVIDVLAKFILAEPT